MITPGFPAGRRVRLALALVLALVALPPVASPAAAAPPKAATLSAQDHADAQRIEQYLNGIHTLAGRFQQYSPDGAAANRHRSPPRRPPPCLPGRSAPPPAPR